MVKVYLQNSHLFIFTLYLSLWCTSVWNVWCFPWSLFYFSYLQHKWLRARVDMVIALSDWGWRLCSIQFISLENFLNNYTSWNRPDQIMCIECIGIIMALSLDSLNLMHLFLLSVSHWLSFELCKTAHFHHITEQLRSGCDSLADILITAGNPLIQL